MGMSDEDAWNITHWWNNGTIEYDSVTGKERSSLFNSDESITDTDNDPIYYNRIYHLIYSFKSSGEISCGGIDVQGFNALKALKVFPVHTKILIQKKLSVLDFDDSDTETK